MKQFNTVVANQNNFHKAILVTLFCAFAIMSQAQDASLHVTPAVHQATLSPQAAPVANTNTTSTNNSNPASATQAQQYNRISMSHASSSKKAAAQTDPNINTANPAQGSTPADNNKANVVSGPNAVASPSMAHRNSASPAKSNVNPKQ